MSERRNYARRAAATRWVVLRFVLRQGAPVEADIPPDAVRRIVRGLAVRGLVRVSEDGWRPAPPLLRPGSLQPTESDSPAPRGREEGNGGIHLEWD